jgi:hypothetical protein
MVPSGRASRVVPDEAWILRAGRISYKGSQMQPLCLHIAELRASLPSPRRVSSRRNGRFRTIMDLMDRKKHSDTPLAARGGARRSALLGAASLSLAACSPALDWHSVPVPGTQLVAELPCRPGRFEREVTVAGLPLKLYMLSCEAGGVTYGVATAEVGDPARVEAVLQALRDGAAAAIRSADSPAGALNMRGATPFSGNSSAHLHGRRPDGEEVEEAIRVFGRGTRVFQASAVGARLPEAALRPFEDGLHFDLAKGMADPI